MQHNEKCVAYAIGCAVQNIRDAMKDELREQVQRRGEYVLTGKLSHTPYRVSAHEIDIIATGFGYLETGSCSCYCELEKSQWAASSNMLETLMLGYVALSINANPDVTGRI